MIAHSVKYRYVNSEKKRLTSGFYLNSDAVNSRMLEENADKCVNLEILANAFNPPVFKRQFCSKNGDAVPYCQSSDITNALDGSEVFINRKQALKVNAVVKKGQILVTGFGTIGNLKLVNELTHGTAYANNVCRIEPYGLCCMNQPAEPASPNPIKGQATFTAIGAAI